MILEYAMYAALGIGFIYMTIRIIKDIFDKTI